MQSTARGNKVADRSRTYLLLLARVKRVADAVCPTSRDAVAALKDASIEVVMLTGDNEANGRRIAAEIDLDTVLPEVLPVRPLSPRPISGSRSEPAPRSPSRRRTWC